MMWLWDRGQPLDSLPPDELCSRKTVLRGLFGLLNGKDFRQFGEAMLYCSNWKGSDHTLGCERWQPGQRPIYPVQVPGPNFTNGEAWWPGGQRPALSSFITEQSYLLWEVHILHFLLNQSHISWTRISLILIISALWS